MVAAPKPHKITSPPCLCNPSIIVFLSHLLALLKSSSYKMIFPIFSPQKSPIREGELDHVLFLLLGIDQFKQ